MLKVISKHGFERRGFLVLGFDMNINPKSYFVLYWYCHVVCVTIEGVWIGE
jgi:hypothetical protein